MPGTGEGPPALSGMLPPSRQQFPPPGLGHGKEKSLPDIETVYLFPLAGRNIGGSPSFLP